MANPEDIPIEERAASLADSLPPGLRHVFANQEGTPSSVLNVELSLLPFGRRAYIEATGITVVGDDGGHTLTDFGNHVVSKCIVEAQTLD